LTGLVINLMPEEMILPEFASLVKGYLSDEEGKALFNLVLETNSASPLLEIGSFCGKSTIYLGTACKLKGLTLFTIDHHMGSEEQQPGQLYFDAELYNQKSDRLNSLPVLLENIKKAELEYTVVPMVTWSKVAAQNWATPLSMVFIDGGHSYDAVLTDFLCWEKHIVSDGYLVFHDIYPDPAKGGQAPYQVYQKALKSAMYQALPMIGSLGILKKRSTVMVQQ
jgi:MMP 1-O-methyltransferase